MKEEAFISSSRFYKFGFAEASILPTRCFAKTCVINNLLVRRFIFIHVLLCMQCQVHQDVSFFNWTFRLPKLILGMNYELRTGVVGSESLLRFFVECASEKTPWNSYSKLLAGQRVGSRLQRDKLHVVCKYQNFDSYPIDPIYRVFQISCLKILYLNSKTERAIAHWLWKLLKLLRFGLFKNYKEFERPCMHNNIQTILQMIRGIKQPFVHLLARSRKGRRKLMSFGNRLAVAVQSSQLLGMPWGRGTFLSREPTQPCAKTNYWH